MSNKLTAYCLFVLALMLFVSAWMIQGLPPAITGIGFVVIGAHLLRAK